MVGTSNKSVPVVWPFLGGSSNSCEIKGNHLQKPLGESHIPKRHMFQNHPTFHMFNRSMAISGTDLLEVSTYHI